ncbi:MAG: hypothetical protein AAFQ80_09345 [Cyanobacteria bacterium J06621_8]
MFKWLSWFNIKDRGLNLLIVNWLGVEREGLLIDNESINWEQQNYRQY